MLFIMRITLYDYKQITMASYAEKQLFKTRFWKHIWDLDPESLRELLDEGNPIGHVNFPFRVPSDHGYVFHTAYKGNKCYSYDDHDKSTSEFRNEAIENYINSYGKCACRILWDMHIDLEKYDEVTEMYLPNGVRIDDKSALDETFLVLIEHGADLYTCYSPPIKVRVNRANCMYIEIYNIAGMNIWTYDHTYEKIRELTHKCLAASSMITREHYLLMLFRYPESFNRFVDEFPRQEGDVFDLLLETKNKSLVEILWKMRLVKLDPERWPNPKLNRFVVISVEGLDGVSVEELQAMYEGHPKNINPHDIDLALSDRPAKKAKSDL